VNSTVPQPKNAMVRSSHCFQRSVRLAMPTGTRPTAHMAIRNAETTSAAAGIGMVGSSSGPVKDAHARTEKPAATSANATVMRRQKRRATGSIGTVRISRNMAYEATAEPAGTAR
jgi:hypothetical protein